VHADAHHFSDVRKKVPIDQAVEIFETIQVRLHSVAKNIALPHSHARRTITPEVKHESACGVDDMSKVKTESELHWASVDDRIIIKLKTHCADQDLGQRKRFLVKRERHDIVDREATKPRSVSRRLLRSSRNRACMHTASLHAVSAFAADHGCNGDVRRIDANRTTHVVEGVLSQSHHACITEAAVYGLPCREIAFEERVEITAYRERRQFSVAYVVSTDDPIVIGIETGT